jgi:hypothetical protein
MSRARDIANLINVAPSIYATDDEVAADYLSKVDAATDYVDKEEAQAPFRNLIINGAMQVAQRGTSTASITTTGYYTADRWAFINTTMGTWTQSVENDAPTGLGFVKSLKVLCTTADASPAAGDFMNVQQIFEGQNLQSICKGTSSAKQLTLQFWVKANVTGTYIARLGDGDNTRSVSAAYTIASSGTWEKKTIVFPADTTGVFDNDNNASLRLVFQLGAGSDRTSGTLQTTWASSVTADEAVGQTNLAAATDNYWQITGVQLEVGAVATPFEFKPIEQDLSECQRYYQQLSYWTGFGEGTTAIAAALPLIKSMRTGPAISKIVGSELTWRTNAATDGTSTAFTVTAGSSGTTGQNAGIWLLFTDLTGIVDNQAYFPRYLGGAIGSSFVVAVQAEL